MFLELLVVVVAALSEIVGLTFAIVIMFAGIIIAPILGYYLVSYTVNSMFDFTNTKHSRREGKISRRERQISRMDVPQLRKRVEKNPRDVKAQQALCDKFKENGDLKDFVRECEILLRNFAKIDVEERSMLHHKLADLYLGPLHRPEKAREILEDFVECFSESSQAKMMRQRLNRMLQ